MDTTHFLIDIKTVAPDRNGAIYEISAAAFVVHEDSDKIHRIMRTEIDTIILRVNIDEQLSYASDVVFDSLVMLELCENQQFFPKVAKSLHISCVDLMQFINKHEKGNVVFWSVTDGENSRFDARWRLDYAGLDDMLTSATPMNVLHKLFPNELRVHEIPAETWIFSRAAWLKSALISLQLRKPAPMHTEQEKAEAARKLMEGITENAIGTLKDRFEQVLNSYGFKYPVNPNNE